ncbi:universal stress protein [Flagellimonas meridianipacifica]|uniref:Nucleotide-binding universal stress UspA family protein n=1 Tax=Flagellimonas meridianipacifica TaxID=1080225 RepID=A0A2T0MI36_9FLAO|nr:universal stress protein [Allomuricauda pacifica]PRX57230.1 nucleotide-binding universal stress UspA family protein [Allomuricauda pacifica]
MNKRVLLPTDYSKNALNAIRYAQGLYANIDCDFYLLNAYQVSGYNLDSMMVPEPGERFYEMGKKASEDGMKKLMAQIEIHPENPKHRFHSICTLNSLVEAIRNLIAKKDIDIIVMGTKGVTAAKNRIFGTNTVSVMEKIKVCPVIAVPEGHFYCNPKAIAFPTDYKTAFKKSEIKHLLEVAKLHDALIHVVHIDKNKDGKLSSKEEANKQLLEDILHGADYESHFLPEVDVAKGINVFVESKNCDMISFMNRRHLFFGSILSNPLVKEIGYNPKIPILELNDNK